MLPSFRRGRTHPPSRIVSSSGMERKNEHRKEAGRARGRASGSPARRGELHPRRGGGRGCSSSPAPSASTTEKSPSGGSSAAGVSVEEGYQSARLCGLNHFAMAKACLGGDLDRIVRAVRLEGYVNSAPGFREAPWVVNGERARGPSRRGCSARIGGKHARAALNINELTYDAPGGDHPDPADSFLNRRGSVFP